MKSSGFTLLETLISLVIASITALVLLQSITAIARSTAGLERATGRAMSAEFTVSAAADALSGAAADYLDSETVFIGGEMALSGLTRKPMFGPQAALRPFAMRLEGDGRGGSVLFYSEGEQVIEIKRFESPEARFEYVYQTVTGLYADSPPERLPAWPPDVFDPFYDYFRPPPDLVLVTDRDGAILWAVRLDGWREPPMRESDLDEVL